MSYIHTCLARRKVSSQHINPDPPACCLQECQLELERKGEFGHESGGTSLTRVCVFMLAIPSRTRSHPPINTPSSSKQLHTYCPMSSQLVKQTQQHQKFQKKPIRTCTLDNISSRYTRCIISGPTPGTRSSCVLSSLEFAVE